MMPRAGSDALPWPVRQELCRVAAMLFEVFADNLKGRLSERYRAGRIVALILHGVHADAASVAPGAAFDLVAIVNHPRLARSESDWRLVRDRLHRAWTFGEVGHSVRLSVHSLEQVNSALAEGVPHFVGLMSEGVTLYAMAGLRLASPRHMPDTERRARGLAEFTRWHVRAGDFLSGAGFYQTQGNAPMAALLLHQACEHLYHCVLWSLTLHGPRSHALDALRDAAEALDADLRAAWPRDTAFARRAFGCIRRAYVEARYGHGYRVGAEELAWAMERAAVLRALVAGICGTRLGAPVPGIMEECHVR